MKDAKSEPSIVLLDMEFSKGIWYQLSIRHSKPRISLFSKDEMAM